MMPHSRLVVLMPHEFDRQSLDENGISHLLSKVKFGHLGTMDCEGKPYVVPLDYRYVDGTIYFHGADRGRKIENIRRNPNVCFEVTFVDPLISMLSSYGSAVGRRWESVVVNGKAEEVLDETEKVRVFGESGNRMHIYKIKQETITGRATFRKK